MHHNFTEQQLYGTLLRAICLCLAVLVTACSEDEGETYRARTVERLYNLGVDALQREDYKLSLIHI